MENVNYKTYIRANILVTIGYALVTLECFIATALGFTEISYFNTLILSLIVISGSLSFILFMNYKKSIGNFFGKKMFFSLVILYFILFSVWVYLLKDFRIFGLFCSILAVTIVVLYASLFQSLVLSLGTIAVYIMTSLYSILIAGQKGNYSKEIFFAFCFIPTSIFFSIVANQFKKKNNELEKIKLHLEDSNKQLKVLNSKLEANQKNTNLEIELACQIQKTLFPETPKNINSWDIAMHFKPRYGLSGDFYDFYYDSSRLTGLSLFDVSGHGLPAALITILAKPVLQRYFNLFRNEQLGRMIEVTDNTLRHDLSEINMYITGVVLRFNENDLEYVNVGHPDMLYKSSRSGKAKIVIEKEACYKSRPIGLLDTISSCKSLKLSPDKGDILVLYTDCITESSDIDKNRYGSSRLLNSLEKAHGTAAEILDFLLDNFNSFMNEKELDDDCSIIVIKKT